MATVPMDPELYIKGKFLLAMTVIKFIGVCHADSFIVGKAIIDDLSLGQLPQLITYARQVLDRKQEAFMRERKQADDNRIRTAQEAAQ